MSLLFNTLCDRLALKLRSCRTRARARTHTHTRTLTHTLTHTHTHTQTHTHTLCIRVRACQQVLDSFRDYAEAKGSCVHLVAMFSGSAHSINNQAATYKAFRVASATSYCWMKVRASA